MFAWSVYSFTLMKETVRPSLRNIDELLVDYNITFQPTLFILIISLLGFPSSKLGHPVYRLKLLLITSN
jgi:hypothetical protein